MGYVHHPTVYSETAGNQMVNVWRTYTVVPQIVLLSVFINFVSPNFFKQDDPNVFETSERIYYIYICIKTENINKILEELDILYVRCLNLP